MKKIFNYLKSYKLRLAIGLTIKIIGTMMDLAIPYILSYILDDVIGEKLNISNIEITQIIIFGVIMVFCAVCGFSFNVIANRMAAYIAKNVTTNVRHDLFVKIEDLSAAQVDDVSVPSLISRMSTDTYNVHQMVGMMQRLGVRAPILLIGGIIVTLTLDPALTLILLASLPLIVLLVYFVSKKGVPLFKKVQLAIDDMVRTIRENITGIRVIKALSKEKYEKERFAKVNKNIIDYELAAGITMSSLRPIMNIILNLGLVGVIVYGAYRVNLGLTGPGVIVAFTSYFITISNAMLSITRLFTIYSRSSASAERIKYILDLPKDLEKVESEEKNDKYKIEFNNVFFSYNKKENNLEDINFKLKRGESLGIIGSTGSGKTTLINLLMRYYDVNSGEILIDGKNIKSYDLETLRKNLELYFKMMYCFLIQ